LDQINSIIEKKYKKLIGKQKLDQKLDQKLKEKLNFSKSKKDYVELEHGTIGNGLNSNQNFNEIKSMNQSESTTMNGRRNKYLVNSNGLHRSDSSSSNRSNTSSRIELEPLSEMQTSKSIKHLSDQNIKTEDIKIASIKNRNENLKILLDNEVKDNKEIAIKKQTNRSTDFTANRKSKIEILSRNKSKNSTNTHLNISVDNKEQE